MNRYISDEERAVWDDLSKDLERAYSIVSAAHYKAITELDHECSKNARNRIELSVQAAARMDWRG